MEKANKINVAQVLPSLGFGGAERIINCIAKYLNKDVYNTYIICTRRGGPLLDALTAQGIKVYILKSKFTKFITFLPFIFGALKAIFELAHIIKQHKIKIIHTHLHGSSEILGFISGKLVGVPVIVTTCHGLNGWFKKYRYLKKLLYSFIVNHSQKLISVSSQVQNSITQYVKLNPRKLIVIKSGIDISESNLHGDPVSMRSSLGLSNSVKVVTTVGNLRIEKGHYYLIRSIPTIIAKYPEAKFLFVGDGVLRNYLENEVVELALVNYVVFLGHRNDISNILSISNLFVLPSLAEGLPLALLEAMAMGVPVIATDLPIMREIIVNNKTGVLVPIKNSFSIAKAILELLTDLPRAAEIGIAGKYIVARQYNAKHMVKQIEDLYLHLLKRE